MKEQVGQIEHVIENGKVKHVIYVTVVTEGRPKQEPDIRKTSAYNDIPFVEIKLVSQEPTWEHDDYFGSRFKTKTFEYAFYLE